jgi:alkylation response protein AidB-like acyl-CoA dehydrogenase
MKNKTEHPVTDLERRFGDVWDRDNPVGFDAIVAADEQGQTLAAGEAVLDAYGFAAEFVPRQWGGRLQRLDRVLAVGRAVFRHDPSLGLGYGASAFIAAVNVWAGGSEAQQRRVAALLLDNRKLACAYHELAHGNDLARVELTALPAADNPTRLRLNGGKQVIANIERADALILYARTDHGSGSRSHSQLLLEKSDMDPAALHYDPRFATIGMRGVQLGGIRWHDCAVDAASIVGGDNGLGRGLEVALKSFQVTRVVLPGMFIGIVDTALRCTVRYTAKRMLYGRAVSDLPQTRAVMVDAFVDLMLADCVTMVAARALHLAPSAANVYSAAVKFLTPQLLTESMTALSAVLGAQFYVRQGEYAIFQKLLRDLKPAGFGHAGRVTCLMTILPQLPGLAKRAWFKSAVAPQAMFDIDGPLPDFSFAPLTLSMGGNDPLFAALLGAAAQLAAMPERAGDDTGALAMRLAQECERLQQACAALPPGELSAQASPASYDLAARYAWLLAASACLNVFLAAPPGAMQADSQWLAMVLRRVGHKLGWARVDVPPTRRAWWFAQLMQRFDQAQTFDLQRLDLPGWRPAAA